MSKEDLHLLFHPRSVAVVGASITELKGGYRILENLLANGFPKSKIYPINPKGGTALGLPFYSSLDEVSDEIDVAIIFVPNKVIPGVLIQCIEKGIRGAIIQAAGFEEIGTSGLQLRDKIREITDNFTKIRIVGPNCTGLTTIETNSSGFFSPFIKQYGYKRGNIGVISQSGMLNGGYLIYLCTKFPSMGFRYIASIGNKMDLTENDFLEYYLNDPTIDIVVCYLENFANARKFIELCNHARKIEKSVFLLKGGKSTIGMQAIKSHTGALAENSNLIQGLINQCHVQTAASFQDVFQYARTRSMVQQSHVQQPLHGNIAMITVSGGAGSVSADLIEEHGLHLPLLDNSTFADLANIYPDWMPPNRFSLLDIWPAIEKSRGDTNGVHQKVIDIVMHDPNIEGLMITVFYVKEFPFEMQLLYEFHKKYKKPIFTWIFGDYNQIQPIIHELRSNNIPTFENLEEMVKNFQILCRS
ncbi:MAG: CoA-binding protein [Promethearchaeota archaeon]